jgi:hypothetical protein
MDGGNIMPSPKVQKLLAAQRTAARFPSLIKISHPEYADMYFANSSKSVSYNGNIYNAASFSIQSPDVEGAKIGNATLTISAIDQFWIERIRRTQTPAQLQFIATIEYDEAGALQIEALEQNSFILRVANWNEISISWEMSFDERMNYIITSIKCTPLTVPGCA